MEAVLYKWAEIDSDNPIPLLTRKMIHAEEMLVARVSLAKGCVVNPHHHVSEQVAIVVSGRVRWTFGDKELEMVGGEVLHLPSNVVHGVVALEDTEIIDILSPPGAMGVDSQGSMLGTN